MRSAEQGSSSPTAGLRRAAQALALGLLVTTAGTAQGQMLQDGPPPQERIVYRNATFLRTNPLGLVNDFRMSYRWRLFRSQSLAARDNFVAVGLAPILSPAYARLGVLVEAQPLTILNLYALYEHIEYFGKFNVMQSFPSARSEHPDKLLRERNALPAGEGLAPYATSGNQMTLGANLQMKVGNIIGRSQFRLMTQDMKLRDGDRVFYDVTHDIVWPNRGWVMTNDADLLYQASPKLMVGVRWTVTTPYYKEQHFAAGEEQENLNGPMHRAGPLVAYTFHSRDGDRFNTPMLFAMANWWLKHRYRAGQETSKFVPMAVVGFTFTGDFLPVK